MEDKEIITLEEEKEEEIAILEENNEENITTLEEDVEGTNNYNQLNNKPQINSVTLQDNKTAKQLGLQEEMESLTNLEIEEILSNFIGG